MVLRHQNVELALPEGWEDQSQTVAAAPAKNGFRTNLVVSHERLTGSTTLEQIASQAIKGLKGAFADLAVKQEKADKIGGMNGLLREIHFSLQGKTVAQQLFFTKVGSLAIIFTFTSLAERMADDQASFRKMLSGAKAVAARAGADDFG